MGRYLLISLVVLGILTMLLPINVSCLEFTTASIYVRTVYTDFSVQSVTKLVDRLSRNWHLTSHCLLFNVVRIN